MAQPTPFAIDIPQSTLDDLRVRLSRTRWPDGNDDTFGASPRYIRELGAYWNAGFDRRAQERALNRFAHFRADVDGVGIHFIHERAARAGALPLILTHGYPDSFVRFLKIIPLLSDPAAHGGDWGTTITEQLARDHAHAVAGIHLTDVPFWHLFQPPTDPTREESAFLEKNAAWQKTEGAYALIQDTRPETLAAGLQDSPIGLAAWLIDKLYAWSDCHGNIESRFTKDELLTNVAART
jgi:pimeloyl-ACP methyl ester carboxylesterase